MTGSPHCDLPSGITERQQAAFQLAAGRLGLAAAAVGASVLAGWIFGIPFLTSVFPGYVAMNPVTAMCFAAVGCCVYSRSKPSPAGRHAVNAVLICVAAAGLLRLGGYALGWSFAIDELVFSSRLHGNRMAPNSAINFVIVSTALLTLDMRIGRIWPAQVLSLISAVVAFFAVIGYIYDEISLTRVNQTFIAMAVNTALLFEVVSVAILHLRPAAGFMRAVTSDGIAGMMSRRLLPAAVLIPLAIGALRVWGERMNLYPTFFGTALFTITVIVVMAGIIAWNAQQLYELDLARRRVEAGVRQANAFLDSVITNLPSMIFVKDAADLRFVRLNRAGQQLIGVSEADVIGKSDLDFFPAEQAEFFIRKDREVLAGSAMVDIPEEPLRTQSGEQRILHTKKIPIRDDAGRPLYLLGISEDITERKLAEQELRRSREYSMKLFKDLQQTNTELKRAMEVKSKFTSMVSHELRTPLTSIKEGIGIVLDGSAGDLNEDQKGFLEVAKRNVDRLHRFINEVLDFSKYQSGKMEYRMKRADLHRLIRDAVQVQLPAARQKNLEIRLELDGQPPAIELDEDKITQVLVNLLSNALKFTERGETAVGCRQDGGFMIVSVRDTGEGVSPENIPMLFVEYQQVGASSYRKPGSTGLGLAICREIIEGHGGRIWVESEPGRGSCFSFSLPIRPSGGDHD